MAIMIFLLFLVIAPVILFSDIKSAHWEEDSRIVNSRGLSNRDRFHLISRWGAQN